MQFIRYTLIDAMTGVPVDQAHAENGPADPAVAGLKFLFALESKYPTDAPVFYGTAPDDSHIDIPGVLGPVTEAECAEARAAEYATRATIQRGRLHTRVASILAERRAAGFAAKFSDGQAGIIQTRDVMDLMNVQAVTLAGLAQTGTDARLSFRDSTNVTHTMTAVEAVALGLSVMANITALYDAKWRHDEAIDSASDDEIMKYDTDAGWAPKSLRE